MGRKFKVCSYQAQLSGRGGGGEWRGGEVAFPAPRPPGSAEKNIASDSPSGLGVPAPKTLREPREGAERGGTWSPLSGDLVRSEFFFFLSFPFLFERILSHHLASPAPPPCAGFALFFTILPPNESLVRSILSSPSSLLPTLPSSPFANPVLRG